MQAKLSPEEKDEIKYFHRLGATVKVLADQYRISPSTVYDLFVANEKKNRQRRICYKNNPNKVKLLGKKWRQSRKGKQYKQSASFRLLYNITIEQYQQKLIEQSFSCAICQKPQALLTKRLHVDHDHSTGKIRGLLCGKCNLKLSTIENKQFCLDASLYLQRYRI